VRGDLYGDDGTIWSLCMSADGHIVLSAGDDGIVRIWEDNHLA